MPSVLNKVADSVLMKIRRHPLYYERYNNTLSFSINKAYTSYAKECQAQYAKTNGPVTLPPSPLFTDGATLVEEAISRERAEGYSKQITKFIEEDAACVDRPPKFEDLQVRIKEPLKNLGVDLLDAFRHTKVQEALLAYFRSHYRIEWVNVFRSLPANRKASSWLWHSDSFPPGTCKLFLHLTPATAEIGATEFMNLQDTHAYRRAGYYGQYLDERYADLEEFGKEHGLAYRPFHRDAKPGDATIFDMNFFHRAVSPREKFRDVMQVYLVPNMVSWEEQLAQDGIDKLIVPAKKGYPNDPRFPHS